VDFPASATDALLMRFAAPVGSGPIIWLPVRRGERAGSAHALLAAQRADDGHPEHRHRCRPRRRLHGTGADGVDGDDRDGWVGRVRGAGGVGGDHTFNCAIGTFNCTIGRSARLRQACVTDPGGRRGGRRGVAVGASRAINGGSRVSADALAAVLRQGFSPNRAARNLVTHRADSVALVVPEPDDTSCPGGVAGSALSPGRRT